jgi:hypothetical protein
MSSKADKDLAMFDGLGRLAMYAALAGIGILVAWLSPRDSDLGLIGKLAVLVAAFLFLYPHAFKSRPASRSF